MSCSEGKARRLLKQGKAKVVSIYPFTIRLTECYATAEDSGVFSQRIYKTIEKVRRGDRKAFDEIVNRYQGGLYNLLLRLTGDRHEAEDLLQETFIRVVQAISTYRHRKKFRGWIYKIASNLARDHARKKKVLVYTDARQCANFACKNEPQREYENEELGDALIHALAELPYEQRQIFLLREEAGLSFREIADHLDISINTALARMHYAVKKLKSKLEKSYV